MDKICQTCKKGFSTCDKNRKYCSHSCAASSTNKTRTHYKQCRNCGNNIQPWKNKRCCCLQCRDEYQQKVLVEKWLQNKIPENELYMKGRNSPPRKFIRRFLFDHNNNACQLCGWNKINQSTNKIPLQVHHIDGNCKNNRVENLQLLCPNCHSLTPTFGALNKGNGKRM